MFLILYLILIIRKYISLIFLNKIVIYKDSALNFVVRQLYKRILFHIIMYVRRFKNKSPTPWHPCSNIFSRCKVDASGNKKLKSEFNPFGKYWLKLFYMVITLYDQLSYLLYAWLDSECIFRANFVWYASAITCLSREVVKSCCLFAIIKKISGSHCLLKDF